MNKVVRWVGATGVAALAGLLLFGAAGMYSASEVEAQSPPAPPATFAGSVTVDGAPAAVGASIQARIGNANCGSTAVFHDSGEARYVVQVAANHPDNPGCGSEGATVSFYVDGVLASPTGSWYDADLNIVNLTVTTAAPDTPTPTPTSTPTSTTVPSDDDDDDDTPATSTPTTVATPKPPATGAGVDGGSSSSTLALLAVLVVGIGAFGAAGAAAARRK